MFTNKERQKQRTGKYGTSRDVYLQELVKEFQSTNKEENKLNIVSHLANFAYDPFNYEYFRNLNIIDLFLDCLTEPSEKVIEIGIAGICNCCPDPANADIITRNDGIPLIVACLSSPIEKIVLYAVTTLYYLCTPSTKEDILTSSIIEQMKNLGCSKTACVQLRNSAQAFRDKHIQVHPDWQ